MECVVLQIIVKNNLRDRRQADGSIPKIALH
jgi:hypothetical protein